MSTLINKINAKYGRAVCCLGSDKRLILRKTATGMLGFDIALSGGLAHGRFTQVWGPESAGKSTVATIMAKNFQIARPKKSVLYIDVEGSFDPSWARASGVDMTRFFVAVPATAEEACELVADGIGTDEIGLVIHDSIGAMSGKAEIEGDLGDAHVAPIPRLLSQFFRRATAAIQVVEDPPAIVLLNQRREKIMAFGDPNVFPGGNALKHFLSVNLQVGRGEQYTEAGKLMPDVQGESDKSGGKKIKPEAMPVVAYDLQIRSKKNKTGFTAPAMRVHIGLLDSETRKAGEADTARDLVRIGLSLGVVQKNGSVYSTAVDDFGERYRGGDHLRAALREDSMFMNALYQRVLKEAIGDVKYSEIEAACFFTDVKKTGKESGSPGWRKTATGKRK